MQKTRPPTPAEMGMGKGLLGNMHFEHVSLRVLLRRSPWEQGERYLGKRMKEGRLPSRRHVVLDLHLSLFVSQPLSLSLPVCLSHTHPTLGTFSGSPTASAPRVHPSGRRTAAGALSGNQEVTPPQASPPVFSCRTSKGSTCPSFREPTPTYKHLLPVRPL